MLALLGQAGRLGLRAKRARRGDQAIARERHVIRNSHHTISADCSVPRRNRGQESDLNRCFWPCCGLPA